MTTRLSTAHKLLTFLRGFTIRKKSRNSFRHSNIDLFLLERNRKSARLANGGDIGTHYVYVICGYIQNMLKDIGRGFKKR